MVRHKTWSDVEVSAYLDGELDAATCASLEAALAEDRALRQRVDDLRDVVAMMRAAPLRESPRNYLLTPSMVAETSARPAKRRRTPLLLMRLATSAVAAAFVVTMGLGVVSRGFSPAMVTLQGDAEYTIEMVDPEKEEVAIEQPAPMIADAPPMEKSVEKALPQQDGAAFEPLPEQEGAFVDAASGMGGGAEEPEGELAAETEIAADTIGAAPKAATSEDSVPPPEASRMITNTVEEKTVTISPEPLPTRVEAEDWGAEGLAPAAGFPPPWLAGALGVATLLLAGATIWMSRKQ